MLAQAPTDLGNWMLTAVFVVNALTALGGLIALFATRREMESVEKRVGSLEAELRVMRDRNVMDKDEILAAGEERARRLHGRMDTMRAEVLEHTDAMRRELNEQLIAVPSRILADLANYKHFGGGK